MDIADLSRVSLELDALASDVLRFLRQVEATAITACEDERRDLLFVAWRIMKRAGDASEVAKEETQTAAGPRSSPIFGG